MRYTKRRIALLRRRNALTEANFVTYWRDRHGPYVASSPGYGDLRLRYAQTHLLQSFGDFPFDGIADVVTPGRVDAKVVDTAQQALSTRLARDEAEFLNRRACLAASFLIEEWSATGAESKVVVLTSKTFDTAETEDTLRSLPGFAGLRRSHRSDDWRRLEEHTGPITVPPIDVILEADMESHGKAMSGARRLFEEIQWTDGQGAVLASREMVFFDARSAP